LRAVVQIGLACSPVGRSEVAGPAASRTLRAAYVRFEWNHTYGPQRSASGVVWAVIGHALQPIEHVFCATLRMGVA